jgi:DNA-binding MarR family transcriptional regulator
MRLTSARWQVLGAIEAGPLSVAQIARNMGLARQNVQRLADALERDGVVEYALNPDHQRAKLVRPTAIGRRAEKELHRRQVQWANRIASAANPSNIQAALELLRTLRARLEAESLAADPN